MQTVLGIIFVLTMIIPTAFGQITNDSIIVTTDQEFYLEGDIIIISGEVRDLYSGTPISLIIQDPSDNIVKIEQLEVESDKTFNSITTADVFNGISDPGTYIVKVQYGTESRSAVTSFEFESFDFELFPPTNQIESITTNQIPEWVRGVFVFWANEQINDIELIEAIKFLVDSGIIVLG